MMWDTKGPAEGPYHVMFTVGFYGQPHPFGMDLELPGRAVRFPSRSAAAE